MNKQHNIQSIDFKDDLMLLVVDGQTYQIPILDASPRLAQASASDRQLYRIAPSGYGIHWITLDEDLSINGLLKIAQPQSQAS
jgi:Protein of unknown function (DUF2442)